MIDCRHTPIVPLAKPMGHGIPTSLKPVQTVSHTDGMKRLLCFWLLQHPCGLELLSTEPELPQAAVLKVPLLASLRDLLGRSLILFSKTLVPIVLTTETLTQSHRFSTVMAPPLLKATCIFAQACALVVPPAEIASAAGRSTRNTVSVQPGLMSLEHPGPVSGCPPCFGSKGSTQTHSACRTAHSWCCLFSLAVALLRVMAIWRQCMTGVGVSWSALPSWGIAI